MSSMRAKIFPAMERGRWAVVIPRLVVAFPLISMDYIGTFVLLWNFFLIPHGLEELGQSLYQGRATRLDTSAGMASGPGALPQESCLIAFLTSSSAVRFSSSQFGSTWGRRAMAFTFAEAGWLRALRKCSAHLSKFCLFSVSI